MVRECISLKRILCRIGVFLLVFLAGAGNIAAEETSEDAAVTVADDAGLLMEEEADWLKSIAEELSQKSGWNVVVATCDDAGGKSAQTVCEDYFNEYTAGNNGISCLVDMDNREIYIATAGMAQYYLNDDTVDYILDEAYEAVSEEDYAQCLYLMVLRSSEAYDDGIPDNATIYNVDTGETTVYRKLTFWEFLTTFLLALIVGGTIYGVIKAKYHLKWGTYEYDFHKSGSIDLKTKEDRFVNQVVTHRKIPKETPPPASSGGGSNQTTVHNGSGGRSFGGGGRKF